MVYSQTKEEKDRFFAHLATLGESEDEGTISDQDDVQVIDVAVKSSTSNSKSTPRGHITAQAPVQKETPGSGGTATATTPSRVTLTSASLTMDSYQTAKAATTQSRRFKVQNITQPVAETNQMFAGLTFFFIPNDDIAKPRKVRIRTAINYGAVWARTFDDQVTHIIVDYQLDFDAACKALPRAQPLKNVVLVKDKWLIDSIAYRNLQQTTEGRFQVKGAPKIVITKPEDRDQSRSGEQASNMVVSKRKHHEEVTDRPAKKRVIREDELDQIVREVQDSKHLPLDKDSFDDPFAEDSGSDTHSVDKRITDISRDTSSSKAHAGFQCMEKHDSTDDNPNSKTIEILQKMSALYDRTGDQWRVFAYRKAIGGLKKQKTLIRTKEQARAIPQIGNRLADKIEEIVATDRLKSLETAEDDPNAKVLQLFMGIYGVGPVQANEWINQGFRTFEDLTTRAKLNRNQKIGIERHEDFQQRIPRSEVIQHGDVVQKALHNVDPCLDAIIGGSYRRGNVDSGDIDILITKRDATMEVIRTLVTDSVIPALKEAGFLKASLAASSRDQSSKWHGASCLPTSRVWRRIDLLFVPWSELGAALIYFTGNDIFNRSLRLLASKKGMRLNQHGLYADVMRGKGRSRVTDGKLLEGHSEVKIFDILGVPWRPPEHRKC